MSAARRTPERYLMARTEVPVVMGEVVWEVAEGPVEERARVAEPPGCIERDMVLFFGEREERGTLPKYLCRCM